ncbi:MAG: arylesterase [Candidatus Abyssubacteria bacterium]
MHICGSRGVYLLVTLLLVSALSCSDRTSDVANLDSDGTTIVCFGDSITAGYGVDKDQAFPALLEAELGIPVINAGVSGDTTADALKRLKSDVFPHNPRLVIVEFGGNDVLQKVPVEDTIANLDAIVEQISSRGAIVVLLHMKTGLIGDRHLDGFTRIAKARRAVLIPDFMHGILANPDYTLDSLHPNPEGHMLIAKRVLTRLRPLLDSTRASSQKQTAS